MTARILGWVLLIVAAASLLLNVATLAFSRTTQGSIEAFIGLLIALVLVLIAMRWLLDGDRS